MSSLVHQFFDYVIYSIDFPGGSDGKASIYNAGDPSSIPGSGKVNSAIFLFNFKMGHKTAETIHNINNTSGLEITNACTLQGAFKKFCEGDDSLDDEGQSSPPLEFDDNREQSLRLILYSHTRSCQRTQC